jgi:hypothetical protein
LCIKLGLQFVYPLTQFLTMLFCIADCISGAILARMKLVSGPRYIPIPGVPLKGWALKYISGMKNDPRMKPGHWMAQWIPSLVDSSTVTCVFDSEPLVCFPEEEARHISEFLRDHEHVETEVVKLG